MKSFDRFTAALEAEEAAERRVSTPRRAKPGRPRLGSPPSITQSSLRFCGAYIDPDTHTALKALAKSQHRTVASLCRVIYADALAGRLVPEA